MAKKFVLVLVLAAIVAGGAFADWPSTATWGGKKNHISGTANLFGVGVTYERFLTDKWSIGGDFYFSYFFFDMELEAGAFARYYIWNGLFAEMGLGFHVHWPTFIAIPLEPLIGAAISPGVGFKFDVGAPGGFYLEPGLKFPITLGAYSYDGYWTGGYWGGSWVPGYSVFGVGFGVIAYVGLGFAF